MSLRPLIPGFGLRGYKLEHRLGTGATGDVWLASSSTGGKVALKARPRKVDETEHEFRREFERLRTMRIPSVVRVLDIGADQGYVFFTMDVARGLPFDRFVQEGQGLAAQVHRTCTAGATVANALAGIHGLKLAHRDLKPANIMVNPAGEAVLLDFGTSRFGAISEGDWMGTAAYMAPEQRVGLPHDHRVDIYALGSILHQSLSGVPASHWKPGAARNSLALLGREVPLRLAHLVDQMVELDPADRPRAERIAVELEALANGREIGSCSWPGTTRYVGDASPLLESSAVVHGPPGTGRKRMIREARWAWFRQGYRSVAGQCDPSRPYGALRQVLNSLFMDQDPEARRLLAGSEAAQLKTIAPNLRIDTGSLQFDANDFPALANALAKVLSRASPIAIVLWDLDRADTGTRELVHTMLPLLPDDVRIWATAPYPVSDMPEIEPPEWGPESEKEALEGILPEPDLLAPGCGATPLESCLRAWRALALWREQSPPPERLPEGLAILSILNDVFPASLANELSGHVAELIATDHLRLVHQAVETVRDRPLAVIDANLDMEATEHTVPLGTDVGEVTDPIRKQVLGFTDETTRIWAQSTMTHPSHAHQLASQAWERHAADPDHRIRAAEHALEAGNPRIEQIDGVVKLQLERGTPAALDRWLQLKLLNFGQSSDFQTLYAQCYVDLELRPQGVEETDLDRLMEKTESEDQKGLVRYLRLILQRHRGTKFTPRRGRQWAESMHRSMPAIAANMLREVAEAHLMEGEYEAAVADCRDAMNLAIEAANRIPSVQRPALTHPESNVSITLSGALIESGSLKEAESLCLDIANRAKAMGMNRSEGAILANLAVAQFSIGDRQNTLKSLARCRTLQSLHRDPIVHTVTAILSARMAIEAGDVAAGEGLLDDAITAAQGLNFNLALAEAWTLALELACQNADMRNARAALATYGIDGITSPNDTWPASLARWFWLTGDLHRALAATDAHRDGHAGLCVRAERSRILLLQGRYVSARECSESLIAAAERMGAEELVLFGRLVRGAARRETDDEYGPLVEATNESRWAHLYLGALHLDAVRRQRNGENVQGLIRRLRRRSQDLGHRLYLSVARTDAW